MIKHSIYKLKSGMTLGQMEERWTRTVIVEEFAKNPMEEDGGVWGIVTFINPETMEFQNMLNTLIMKYDDFCNYFEPYMSQEQVNDRLREVQGEEG